MAAVRVDELLENVFNDAALREVFNAWNTYVVVAMH